MLNIKKQEESVNKPLIFLFTCVKNGRKYIHKLFDSLLSQTDTNFVHYIYEDGSEDPIEDLILDYKEKASKLREPFKIIYEKNDINIGLNLATKHCIDVCDYPFFIWVDCDNWLSKNFIKCLERGIVKNRNALFFRTNTLRFCQGKIHNILKNKHYRLSTRKKNAKFSFFNYNYYYSFFAVNTSKFKELNNNKFINEKIYFNDEQVLTTLFSINAEPIFVKKAKGYYYIVESSESHNNRTYYNRLEFVEKLLDEEKFKNSIQDIKEITKIGDLTIKFMELNYNGEIKEARLVFKERNYLCKKMHISFNVANSEGNQLIWLLFLYFPFIYKLYKFLKKKYF